MNETKHSFVLASSSPRRIELLNSIKIFPKIIYSSDINEDINNKFKQEKLWKQLDLMLANTPNF